MLPGFDHAVLPTPVKLAPEPAFLGPLVCPVKLLQTDVAVNCPLPPTQTVVPVVVGEVLIVTAVLPCVPQHPALVTALK